MRPFKLRPYYAEYLWGGRRLKEGYNKTGAPDILAESWELSARPGRACVIASGGLSGMGFDAFVREHPECCAPLLPGGEFPLLLKLIDAAQSLSVQVHPDDDYARRVEGCAGKTEMWIVLECEPGAFIYYGFDRALGRAEAERRVKDGSLAEVMRAVPVAPGDVFYIPAGTVHALGAGIVLAEIQQNSDATYRIYDFGRVDANGNPRELHAEKALDVMNLTRAPDYRPREDTGGAAETLIRCPYFEVRRLRLNGSYEYKPGGGFCAALCVGGGAVLSADKGAPPDLEARRGETIFIPSDCRGFTMTGDGEFILAFAGG
ncbi:MAG: class I mannose-6-phosphate isomerase [Oscillospiraceae bacterium]|nr:class I mannose-6-phosphate isomerase [Oscillospiraceae bacterium]